MTTAAPTETLHDRLHRQTEEYQSLIGPQADQIHADLRAANDELNDAAKADDQPRIAAANDAITALFAKRDQLTTTANHKDAAVKETRRLIDVARRQAAVARFHAANAKAAPLVAAVDLHRYALIDAIKALAANRSEAYAALSGYSDDQQAFNSVASMFGTYGDVEHALKAALNLPQEAGPARGDATAQQIAVAQLADSIR